MIIDINNVTYEYEDYIRKHCFIFLYEAIKYEFIVYEELRYSRLNETDPACIRLKSEEHELYLFDTSSYRQGAHEHIFEARVYEEMESLLLLGGAPLVLNYIRNLFNLTT